MSGLGDLFGANGVLEQLLLWGVVNQVITALASPAFTALTQDVQAKNPNVVLSPDVLATAVARHLVTEGAAAAEASRSGVDATRFDILRQIAQVRLAPADLATAVLRSYMTDSEAQAEARPQGVSADQLAIMTNLAGDAPGADQLVAALRRGIIHAAGRGAESTSYEQGIAETRLHNKWGPVLEKLSAAILSPPDAATAVVRNFMTAESGQAVAEQSGVDAAMFAILTHLAGDAPGPQQLAEALRRGAIPEHGTGAESTSFDQGIAEGRLANKWADVIKSLSKLWPTPVDALDAALKGQVTPEQGKDLYQLLGGDMQFYTWLLNSRGSAPTPLEAIEMANRGIIPWTGKGPNATSYEQAFLEGPWRDKWEGPYRELGAYVPPESTVVTLLAHGAIDPATAGRLLAKQGMDADTIAAYLDEAHSEALSDYRGATVTMVLEAYHAQIISAEDATVILEALHVTPQAVALMLAYNDIQRSFQAVGNAISRVRSLYAARKITQQTARASLERLKVPAKSIDPIMSAWDIENSISVKTLTETQIIDAWVTQLFTDTECATELENIGYTPFDAWALMSIKAKVALPNKPATGPAAPQAQVIPGTT